MPMAARELGPGATPVEPASDPLDDLSKMGLEDNNGVHFTPVGPLDTSTTPWPSSGTLIIGPAGE